LGYFDEIFAGDVWSRLTNDTLIVKQGINATSMALYCGIISVCGVVIMFIISWKLSLVMLSVVPFIIIGIVIESTLISKYTTMKLDALSEASKTADEMVKNIKIIKSYCAEQNASLRYGRDHNFRVFRSPSSNEYCKRFECFRRFGLDEKR
jgi:ATP-binding cassette, subfamily B, bacterial